MTGRTRRGPLIIAAATASIAAAACYLVMLPAYGQTSVPAALWWALAAAAQVALAVATLRAPSRFLWPAAGVAAAVAVASLIVRTAAGADLKNVL